MLGRDLIIYIIQNGLENEPVFKNGTFIGFITMEEAAAKYNVGVGTIYTWMVLGRLDYVKIGEEYLVSDTNKLIAEFSNED